MVWFGFSTAFIFYFENPYATTNSKYFSPISGELDNTKLVPIKLAALNVLEGPQAVPTPTEATPKATALAEARPSPLSSRDLNS